MTGRERNFRKAIVLVSALLTLVALAAPAADAKKKKSKSAELSAAVNQVIPQPAEGSNQFPGPSLKPTLTVGKKFKGKTVGSVAVTLKTTGSGPDSAAELSAALIAPDGTTVQLLGFLSGQSIGPLTLVPNSPLELCPNFFVFVPPNPPVQSTCGPDTLAPPFAGTAGAAQLRFFAGLKMAGTWTLRIRDNSPGANTSTLNSFGLKITPAKAPKTAK